LPSLAIVGPTASGKSSLALALARTAPGIELVSVDSMQVYRGMDIGTAKPTPAERAEVTHHGIDLAEPTEEVTVVRFQAAVAAALTAIAERRHRAVFVGGTGLYLRAVIDRLDPPGQWPDVRAELEREPDTHALHQRLAALDPVAAGRIEPANRRRVLRALEVCLGSGRGFSSFGPGLDRYPTTDVIQIGLRWSRRTLTERIEARFDAQLASGWVEEAAALAGRPLSRTAGQALGYRELFDHLDGRCSLDEARTRALARTRRFAVRQERWFRRDPRIRWFDVDVDADPLSVLPSLLTQDLACV
jgi:tRNA dimethylallyltransferase